MKIIHHIILSILILASMNASFASFWKNLWQRPDQQGMSLLQQGKPSEAANKFKDKEWKGIAQYRAGKYDAAAKTLDPINNPLSLYNQGNALAQIGKYDEAINAYDKALKKDPNDKDAIFNRDLLKKLLAQQKQQQQKEQQKQSSKNKLKSSSKEEKKQSTKQKPDADPKKEQAKAGSQKQPQKQEQQKTDQKQNQQQKNEQQDQTQQHQQQKQMSEKERDEAKKHWLSQIPEDPGGLLRQKFLRDYQRRHGLDQGE